MDIYKEGKDSFLGFDDSKLFYRYWKNQNEKTAVIISHGYGEHSGRYEQFSEYFKDSGLSFFALDHRGHGNSDGQRAFIEEFSEYVRDLHIFHKMIKERYGCEKIVLLGHSMGGVIAAHYAIAHGYSLDGLILSAPYFLNAVKIPAFKEALGKVLSNVAPHLSMPAGVATSHLSHDTEVVKTYEQDPLVHDEVPTRWFTEVVLKASPEAIEKASVIPADLPILMLHGTADKMADIAGTRQFYNKLLGKNVDYFELKDFYHEVYNEVEKEKAFSLTKEWFKKNSFIGE